MALEYFLKLDGIEGEGTRKGFEKQLEAEAFEWGELSPVSSGGGGAGKVEMQDLQVSLRSSKASPALFLACASGKHLKSAVLSVVRPGSTGSGGLAMRWTLTEVLVSAYQVGGMAAEAALPLEQVGLSFAKIEVEFFPQTPQGNPGTPVRGGWDRKANKSF